MAGLKSARVFEIPVQLHGHFSTAVKTANVDSFADPGHKTALYGSSTVTKNLQFYQKLKSVVKIAQV
jgi:ABC-type transport system involved in cytochrome c biogenesis ATPase subunit